MVSFDQQYRQINMLLLLGQHNVFVNYNYMVMIVLIYKGYSARCLEVETSFLKSLF